MQSQNAVIAKRADPAAADSGAPDTEEIRDLADAAGHEVVAEVTQTRAEHPATQFGSGKTAELAETVAETGASLVVFDNDLSPGQTFEVADRCPEGTRVLDRYRLVLDIFEEQAGTERASLQVERAQLTYDLPRIREEITREVDGEYGQYDEQGGQRVADVERRIDELDRKLAELGDETQQRRATRREEGFEFVALAGYTNAGKSTLLHRLADDLDFGEREADHADLDATAAIRDRLFETLDTTTRRATIRDRRTLVTDTVGFVRDLPHDLVASFHETLSETESADCVVVVADSSDSPADLRAKLDTSFELVADAADRGSASSRTRSDDAEGEVITVLNKADLLDADELAEREQVVAEAATDAPDESSARISSDAIAVSAVTGDNLDALRDRIAEALPDRREAELTLPNGDAAMSLVSWLYDHASVEDVSYGDDEVRISFAGHSSVVEKAEARAEEFALEV